MPAILSPTLRYAAIDIFLHAVLSFFDADAYLAAFDRYVFLYFIFAD